MAEEYKNVPEHESPKIATEESSAATGEVKDRGLFDFLGKKEEVKPQETPLEHKTQISEPTFVAKHEEEEHNKTQISEQKEHQQKVIEELHEVTEEEEENKPSLIQKLHRSNSSSSSSSEEEGEDGEKRKKKKENKKIVEGGERTEEEKQGIMDKIKEKLPGHGNKPEDGAQVVVGEPVTIPPPVEHSVVHSVEEHPAEKKGILEKIKEKLPGHHAKSSGEEEKKEKESE